MKLMNPKSPQELLEYIFNRTQPCPNTGCWFWECTYSHNGYGHLPARMANKTGRVHRLVWECLHGSIPKGYVVMHSCDMRSCCNPDHLSIGTQKQNLMDASRKGRLQHCKNGEG